MKIYVGNLPHASTEDSVRQAFSQHGEVATVRIIMDRETGQSRGFGFVDMPNNEEAQNAISKMNGVEFEGRRLNVNEARESTERPPRRFDDRNGGGGPRRNNNGGGFRSRF